MVTEHGVSYQKELTHVGEAVSAIVAAQDRRIRRWGVLFVLCGAIFLEGIDVSMMGVALPSIRAELGLDTGALQWVVSGYVLGYGGFVLLGGRAADLLGRRRMFVGWLVVFLAFSGLGGIATEAWMLILARFATGVAAAFLAPAGLSIIMTLFAQGAERNRAMLVYAGVGAGGFSLGMVVGGLLTALGWRWVFFAPVLLAALLLVAAILVLPREARATARLRDLDLPGAVTLTAGMLLLVFAIVHAPDVPIGRTVAVLAAAAALLGAFVAVERRSRAPLMRLGILRNAALVRANIGAAALVGPMIGFQFVAVLYLQELRGWTTVETGLALAVAGIDAVLAPTLTPLLVRRFGTVPVATAGLVAAVGSYLAFAPLGPDWDYWDILPSMLLLGVAFTLAYGPLTIAATDGTAANEEGLASALLTMSFQFGAAVGLAVVTAVVVAADDVAHARRPARRPVDDGRGRGVRGTGGRERDPAQGARPRLSPRCSKATFTPIGGGKVAFLQQPGPTYPRNRTISAASAGPASSCRKCPAPVIVGCSRPAAPGSSRSSGSIGAVIGSPSLKAQSSGRSSPRSTSQAARFAGVAGSSGRVGTIVGIARGPALYVSSGNGAS